MNSHETVLVQSYFAVLLHYCIPLPDSCPEKYGFVKTPLVTEVLTDEGCMPKCMWNPTSQMLSNENELFSEMAQVVYCSVQCLSQKFGLIDEKGSIVVSNILEKLEGGLQPSQSNQSLCFDRNYEETQHNSITYNDKALQAAFCLWKEAQLICKPHIPTSQEEFDAMKNSTKPGKNIDAKDVFGCFLPELKASSLTDANLLDALKKRMRPLVVS